MNTDARIRLAKWYARRAGLHGRAGGWIYTAEGRVVCQGYLGLYHRHYRALWALINGEDK